MAKAISQLSSVTDADGGDILPIVDVSASPDETKQITVSDFMGSLDVDVTVTKDAQSTVFEPTDVSDGGAKNSPTLTLRAKHDSDTTSGVTSTSTDYTQQYVSTLSSGSQAGQLETTINGRLVYQLDTVGRMYGNPNQLSSASDARGDFRWSSTNEVAMLQVDADEDQVSIHGTEDPDYGALFVHGRATGSGADNDVVATLGEDGETVQLNGNNTGVVRLVQMQTPSLTSSNAVSPTHLETLGIESAPDSSDANVNPSNTWALRVASGASRFAGNVEIGSTLNMTASSSIQDAGTNAITFDGSANVTIPNTLSATGTLDGNGSNITFGDGITFDAASTITSSSGAINLEATTNTDQAVFRTDGSASFANGILVNGTGAPSERLTIEGDDATNTYVLIDADTSTGDNDNGYRINENGGFRLLFSYNTSQNIGQVRFHDTDGSGTTGNHLEFHDGEGSPRLPNRPSASQSSDLVLDSNEQMVVPSSSQRYKTDYQPVDGAKLLDLDPRTFVHHGEGREAGLIAEEVAQVEPRLVRWEDPDDLQDTLDPEYVAEHAREDGKVPDGVHYKQLHAYEIDQLQDHEERLNQLEEEVIA